MALQPSSRLGSYEILAAIGAGGMGEVYKARDPKLQRDVAIKALPPQFSADPERVARFEREAQALAALNHPNIAGIYELLEHDGARFLVLEFVEGETLAAGLARAPLPIDDAIPIAKQIADALEAAHEKGIVHRDLKPANIVVMPDGQVKVLDFGLAKALEPAGAESTGLSQSPTMITLTAGMILGTAAYMSPEQARGKPVDRRADIWAFGCVLFEMLTGKQVFGGETVSDTIGAVMRAEPDWSLLPPETPQLVRNLLRRCFSKDVRGRLPHIGVARLDLEEPSQALPHLAVASAQRVPRLMWMALLATSVTAAALATMIVFHREPQILGPIRFDIERPAGTTRFGHSAGPGPAAPHFAVSPDGRHIAFSAVGDDGSANLWTRPLTSTDARKLAGTEGAAFPFWSPDSREIGFFVGTALKRIAIDTASVVTICEAGIGEGGTWGRDGTILYGLSGGVGSGIVSVSAAGGVPSEVTVREHGTANHQWPSFLPDGKSFFYSSHLEGRASVARLHSLVSHEDVEVVTTPSRVLYAAGQLLFLRDGQLLAQAFDESARTLRDEPRLIASNVEFFGRRAAFHATDGGVLVYRTAVDADAGRLVWRMRNGVESSVVDSGRDFGRVALAPDGLRAIVQIIDTSNPLQAVTGDLWMYDLTRGVRTRFTADPAFEFSPVWSPDGRTIAYASASSRGAVVSALWIKAAGGAQPARQVSPANAGEPSGWTADGRGLVVTRRNEKTGDDIWIVPVDGGPAQPLLQTTFNERSGRFSPGGRWFAYMSDESGQPDVYVQPIPRTEEKWRVSPNSGSDPVWSHDGRELYYVWGTDLYVAAIGGPRERVGAPQVFLHNAVTAGPAGAFRPGWDLRRTAVGRYAVTADGDRFLLIAPNDPTRSLQPPLKVLVNWPELLRQD